MHNCDDSAVEASPNEAEDVYIYDNIYIYDTYIYMLYAIKIHQGFLSISPILRYPNVGPKMTLNL